MNYVGVAPNYVDDEGLIWPCRLGAAVHFVSCARLWVYDRS